MNKKTSRKNKIKRLYNFGVQENIGTGYIYVPYIPLSSTEIIPCKDIKHVIGITGKSRYGIR